MAIRHGFTDDTDNGWGDPTVVGDIAAIEAAQDAAQAAQNERDAVKENATKAFAEIGIDFNMVARHYRSGGIGLVRRFFGEEAALLAKKMPYGWDS